MRPASPASARQMAVSLIGRLNGHRYRVQREQLRKYGMARLVNGSAFEFVLSSVEFGHFTRAPFFFAGFFAGPLFPHRLLGSHWRKSATRSFGINHRVSFPSV